MSGRNVFVERLSRSVKYEDLYLRAYNLGGHPKPANEDEKARDIDTDGKPQLNSVRG